MNLCGLKLQNTQYTLVLNGYHFRLHCINNLDIQKHQRRRQWHPTPVLLPGKSRGWRSLAGCSPWGRKKLDTTERLQFHFSLSCIGEGNGNPLQCSCLENPKEGGAWWAAVYGLHSIRRDWSDLAAANFLHHRLDGRESEWTPRVGDGEGGLACCDSWGGKELDMTERLNWLTDWGPTLVA